ncbi:CAAX amino protease [Microbacterium faecale]|uniref:CAAX amino protease n=1 Tax=Microbacterium faecale TaxID=1804630 RepID=A0A916Y7T4_9MICO|nr:CPBP family intramembrane glutamic endopeptidase [Microbacterium faecale]GGD33511.1 CAAX amino protease [Microbacterium faecale]
MRLTRLLIQLGQFVVVQVVGLAAGLGVVAVGGNPALAMLVGVASAVAGVLAYAWLVRITERRAVTEVAVRGSVPPLVAGVAFGVVLFAIVIGIVASFGGYHVVGMGSGSALAVQVGVMAVAATTEELAFRGVLFRIIEERAGTWAALVGSSALFGALHLINPEATLWGAFAIAVEAGGMLGAAYVVTRSLWLPIGLHFGWNIAESGIFGTVVSGSTASSGLLEGVTSGPTLLTGGAFGPEAGLPAVLGCLVVTTVLLLVARGRGRFATFRSVRQQARADRFARNASLAR